LIEFFCLRLRIPDLIIKPFFIGTKLVQADIGPIFVSSIVPGRSARVGV